MIKNYFHIQLFFPPGFSKTVNLLLLCVVVFCCGILAAEAAFQPLPGPNPPDLQGERQKEYPESWDINIVPGTKLETLAQTYDKKIALLPADDLVDQAPLPRWFRAYLREKLAGLPKKGRPQYPGEAVELLCWLEKNQDFSRDQLSSRLERLRQKVESVKIENKRRALYPAEWEVEVPAGTKLDKLRKRLDAEFCLLPDKDLEDTTPLPVWFRVYMRKQFPALPKSGPYQYPRTASRILQRMLSSPDADEIDENQD